LEKLGKYLILGELGRGAGGVVYRARDPILNRLVALKTITTGLAEFPELLERFYQEAQSAGGLQHPNIVTIYDLGDEKGIPYIAMELVEGETLDQLIARRPNLPLPLKLTYALQACRAFDYAHKRGIIHRDIKPDNVMLGKDGTVKVVDFGIARVLETSKTQTGMLLGTFAYMSPEQYHGEHADARSDIWSFGILLYELLAYQRPFRGQTPASLMLSICQQDPTPLTEVVSDCPAALEKIIKKVLSKSPADRYQSMEELLLDLDPICKSLQADSVAGLVSESRQLAEQGDYPHSRDLLRQALQIDSSHTQARNLLEKVNIELRRISVRPKVQQHVEKGQAYLAEKKIPEARAEVESALQLDSSFEPAQALQKEIQLEVERAQMVAEWLGASRQRLAEGNPDDAEELLAKVLESEPANQQALTLRQQVIKEKEERQRRLRLLEKMQTARGLWTQQNYGECIQLLKELQSEFPDEEEIPGLLETAREDQANQKRVQGLVEARGLLANRRYEECRTLLAELRKQFPSDEEIPRLEQRLSADQAKQRRLQSLADARNFLAARRYDDCMSLLGALQKEFPDEEEIPKLRNRVLEDQAKQRKAEALAEARNLLAARRYDDSLSLLASLQKDFPAEEDVSKLKKEILADQAKQKRLQALGEARSQLAARRYDECISQLTNLQKEFKNDDEIAQLLASAREEKTEHGRQQGVAQARKLLAARQYEECKALLADLQKQFPKDDEISRLIDAIRKEEAEQRRAKSLTEARNLLASRRHAESTTLLLSLQKLFPNDEEISKLLEEVRKDEAEQNKLKGLTEARGLLAARKYEETITLLVRLQGQYPGDNEISKLLETAREHEAEERKLQGLTEGRNLLAARRYDESIALLMELQKKFPGEEEVARLLETAREDRAEQDKQKKLAEVRTHLAARRFREALGILEKLQEVHAKDPGVQKLCALALQEQEKQASQERLERKLKAVKKLVNEKKYPEVLADAENIQREFPGDADLARLVEFARGQQSQLEREHQLRKTLEETKGLITSNRFEEAYQAAVVGLKTFPGNQELLVFKEQADTQQRKLETRQHIEQRIREIKVKINRGKISEAIDLANRTLVTLGPDTDVTQLLNSARVEYEAREKKREQEIKLESIRSLIAAGKLLQASRALDDAVEAKVLEVFDPRVQRVCDEMAAAKSAAAVSGTQTPAASLSKEYAWLQRPPLPEDPEVQESKMPDIAEAKASATIQPTIPLQPPAPPPPPKVVSEPSAPPTKRMDPTPLEPVPFEPAMIKPGPRSSSAPATPAAPPEIQRNVPAEPPVDPMVAEEPVRGPLPRNPAVLAAIALGAIFLVWAGIRLVPSLLTNGTPATETPKVTPSKPQENPVEGQQRAAMDAADKRVAANDLDGALRILDQAKTLNGPLAAEIQTKRSSIQEAMQNQNLRALRQKEEQLWQQAKSDVSNGRFREAEKSLQQILAMGDGGLRKSDARQYLAKTIPDRQQEEKLFTQARQTAQKEDVNSQQSAIDLLGRVIALDGPRKTEAQQLQNDTRQKLAAALTNASRQDLQRGDFRAARSKAAQLRQDGSDGGPLFSEIDQAEQTRFTQLETQFNQLKQSDDDAAAQQLGTLQRGFQALTDSSGPRSDDAKNILNNLPAAIRDVHARAAGKQAQAATQAQQQKQYQQALQNYNAADSRDKSALEKSRNDFQTIVNANSAHAGDAQQYVVEINKKLDALNAPPQPPPTPGKVAPNTSVADEAAIRTVVQSFFQSWEQRSADALRQSWPSIPQKRYDAYKSSFDNVSEITIKVVSEGVKINLDGTTATVSVQSQEEQTPNGEKKSRKFTPAWTFQLAKSNGTWLITDVQ
jgi:serine/threonine protein kinase